MIEPIVSLNKIYKSYQLHKRPVAVLTDFSLQIEPGESVSIVGPSGSGKSTLLNLLAGFDRPDQGSVQVAGYDLNRLPATHLSHYRNSVIGFIFQAYNLLPEFNLLDNVALPLLIAGAPLAAARGESRQLLERLGLGDRLLHRPSQLSGGQQQRAAIGRAIIASPQLLLADEPTGNLDTTTARQVLDMLFQLNRQGKTLVIVTHDPEIAALTDRQIELSGTVLEPLSI